MEEATRSMRRPGTEDNQMPLPSLGLSDIQALLPRDSQAISGPRNPTSLGSNPYLAPSYTVSQLAYEIFPQGQK